MGEKKLWQGRFKGASEDVTGFNSSENAALDQNLVKYDILGSIAHVKMLEKHGMLKKEEKDAIVSALKQILQKQDKGGFELDESLEDVHTNVENAVTAITPHGKKMHLARSRNDQILVDMRMYMRDKILEIAGAIMELQKNFAALAEKDGAMAGYTHTRVAQPITISFWCDSFVQSFYRDLDRILECFKRVNENPLGACALAGTSWNIDRGYTARLLGFDDIQENELDAITSRGEVEAEMLSDLSIMMTKLSGLAEELIWLSQKQLIALPDEFCTGSSIMPNKKNPDALELIRARAGRVYSNLVHALTVKKSLISGYHSDMQESKHAIMGGAGTTLECVAMMAKIIKKIKFNQGAIEQELEAGFAQATEIADALAKKGVPFRDAHSIVGKLVGECETQGITLSKAKPLPQFNEKEWKGLVSIERARLKRKIAIDGEHAKAVKEISGGIEGAFKNLLLLF